MSLEQLPPNVGSFAETQSAISGISASDTIHTQGTVRITGGANITVGTDASGISIIGAAGGAETQTGISSIAVSDATYTSGSVQILGSGGVDVRSTTGQGVRISAATQSVQTQSAWPGGVRAISVSDTVHTLSTFRLTGGPNVTVGSDASGASISVDATAAAADAVRAISASNNEFTLSTVRITGGPNVTVGSDASGVSISGASQSVQTQSTYPGPQTGISSIAASDATYTSGQVQFTGSNMVTVKSSAGQRVVVDATQSVQTQSTYPGGVRAISVSDTVHTQTTVRITGGPGITVGSDASGASISGAAQTVQTQSTWPGGVRAISVSDTVHTLSTFRLTGGPNVTVGSDASGASISVDATAAAADAVRAISVSNTEHTLSTFRITGGPNITVGSDASGASISGPANQTGISSIVGSDATYTSGSVQFTGSNMVTVKSSANQRLVIDATQSVQTQGTWPGAQTGISSIAASDTTYTSGSVQFTGSNAVTVKSSANQRVVIDAPVQSAQTQSTWPGGVRAISVSDTVHTLSTFRITGGPNVTVGSDTAGATISGAANQTGISSIAASDTTYTSGSVQFTGSNMVTIKSSANQRVVVDATQSIQTQSTWTSPTLLNWRRGPAATVGQNPGQGVVWFFPLMLDGANFPGRLTASTIYAGMSYNVTATAQVSQALSSTLHAGIYTLNASTLSLLNSGSASFGNSNASTANTSNWNGPRMISMHSSAWSVAPSFSEAQYWMALMVRSHITTTAASWIAAATNHSIQLVQHGAASSASRGAFPMHGQYTAGSAALPVSAVTGDVSANIVGFAAQNEPWVMFNASPNP